MKPESIAKVRSWLDDIPTTDPEVLRKREEFLDELKEIEPRVHLGEGSMTIPIGARVLANGRKCRVVRQVYVLESVEADRWPHLFERERHQITWPIPDTRPEDSPVKDT